MATRWAHREDIEAGYQKAISYHGKWYLIEKFDSADLNYQIVGRLTDREIAEYEKRVKDGTSNVGQGQSLQQGIGELDRLN